MTESFRSDFIVDGNTFLLQAQAVSVVDIACNKVFVGGADDVLQS